MKTAGGDGIAVKGRNRLNGVYLRRVASGAQQSCNRHVLLAVGQPSGGPPLKPITDPDAYSIYATLLPSVWKLSGE